MASDAEIGMLRAMRSRGLVTSARGLGDSDHLSWVYAADAHCHDQAVAFLADGRARNLRVGYTGLGDIRQLRADLDALPNVDELIASEALELLPLEAVYGVGPVQGASVVKRYDAFTARALADGYNGYRVAADVTSLVSSPAGIDAFARYEIELDTYMTSHPFSAMCAYADSIGDEGLVQLACLHPLGLGAHAPFQITIDAEGVAHLDGEIDFACRAAFAETVARIDDALTANPSVVNLGGVVHIDHRGLVTLERRAARRGLHLVLREAPKVVHRILELLDLPHMELERA